MSLPSIVAAVVFCMFSGISINASRFTSSTFGALGSGSHQTDPDLEHAFEPYKLIQVDLRPDAVAVADLNQDGLIDILVSGSEIRGGNYVHGLFLFFQDETGDFKSPIKYDLDAHALSMIVADLNGDGKNDIAAGLFGVGLVRVYFQNSPGDFGSATNFATENARMLSSADLNNDGRSDLSGISRFGSSLDTFIQSPAGTLNRGESPSAAFAYDSAFECKDVSNDGLADFVMLDGSSPWQRTVVIVFQKQDGFSEPISISLRNRMAYGLGFGDVTGDGLPDIVVTHPANRPESGLSILAQRSGALPEIVANLESYDIPESVVLADLDGDSRDDIVTLHGGWNRLGVYFQRNPGRMDSERLFAIPGSSHYSTKALAIGDVTGDGKPDVVIAEPDHGLVVMKNRLAMSIVAPLSLGVEVQPLGTLMIRIRNRVPGKFYKVERSKDLKSWRTLGTTSEEVWIDSSPATGSVSFYRIVEN